MQIEQNLPPAVIPEARLPAQPIVLNGPDGFLPAHSSLRRVLGLLGSTNIRLSLFSFESLPGAMTTGALFSAVEKAVDDFGLAFGLDDGRVGALVYGWRPPNADDSWVEDRTLARLDWALGGPLSSADMVDVYAVHRCSSELSDSTDVAAALSCGRQVRHIGHFSLA